MSSGLTQCTRLSSSGEPKRLLRGGGAASGIVSVAAGCSFRDSRCSSAWMMPEPTWPAKTKRPHAFRIGPADHYEFLAVQAVDLEPQAAVAGRVSCIGALRDDALERQRAGLFMKFPAANDLVISVVQGWRRIRQQRGEPGLPLDQRPRPQIFAIGVQKIEQKEHQRRGVAAVGRQLDHAERDDAVGADAARLAVEIGLACADR